MKLSDEHLKAFHDQGFVVVEDFYPEDKRAQIASAVRKQLPPWEELNNDPPENGLRTVDFPFDDMFFNELIVDWDLINFVQRVLDTEDIHFRYAHNWARYPCEPPPQPHLHVDNGNNSLLPPCDDVRYGQISTWYFPEEVQEHQAPMLVIPKAYGRDVRRKISLTVPAGTQMIFNTFLWHSATPYLDSGGQRYSVTRIYGRADHYWEGVQSYTNQGRNERLGRFIGTLTARERELFRFPPVGNPYYTDKTLELLEVQYPGWNARNEYIPETHVAPGDQSHFGGTEKSHE
ncbi:MAG: hypothetical protein VYA69_13025 [Gemmatimonadota bacterium]|nr:hypothetical protein [Gemmatimonadota bacterium]